MSLKEFRDQTLERLLQFLWRQWSALGVLGTAGTDDRWIIDPEALLAFSLQIARYDPRLFDEILSWLLKNGRWLDAARLRRIIVHSSMDDRRVAAGALTWAGRQSSNPKWDGIIKTIEKKPEDAMPTPKAAEAHPSSISSEEPSKEPQVLFFYESGEPHPPVPQEMREESFDKFGLIRMKIKNLKTSPPVPVNATANVRFLLRSLFGVGSRAEILLYLLTHEGGHPRDAAESIGLFWLGVQQTLFEMAESGLVLKRAKGKRVEYWLSHKKWWDFLSFTGDNANIRPLWLNWTAIFSALGIVWKNIDDLTRTTTSDYLKNAKLLSSLQILHSEFSRAGLDVPAIPNSGLPPDLFQTTILQFFERVLR